MLFFWTIRKIKTPRLRGFATPIGVTLRENMESLESLESVESVNFFQAKALHLEISRCNTRCTLRWLSCAHRDR